jgi:threonine synthase
VEIQILQEIEYERLLNKQLIEQWADGIPYYEKNNPSHPEWDATPTKELNLTSEGYGLIHIKDESVNPTCTIKDRAAWENTTLFRDFARQINLKLKQSEFEKEIRNFPVPRMSYITAGNMGNALSNAFKKYNLPPIKLLVHSEIPQEKLDSLKKLYADIYLVNLNEHALTPADIKYLTNNTKGIDITSVMILETHAVFYDWHVHEAFNTNANEIYLPYGSGRLFENYLTWQMRNMKEKDPRLNIPQEKLSNINIIATEPETLQSIADKLTKPYNPFAIYGEHDLQALKTLKFTGQETNIIRVSEEKIKQAHTLLSKHYKTEPSASAGLASYLERYEQGKINPNHKILIINTGQENIN